MKKMKNLRNNKNVILIDAESICDTLLSEHDDPSIIISILVNAIISMALTLEINMDLLKGILITAIDTCTKKDA